MKLFLHIDLEGDLTVEQKEEGLDLGDDAFTIQEESKPPQKFMSLLLTNLDVNYDGWRAELPPEEGDEEDNKEKENVSIFIVFPNIEFFYMYRLKLLSQQTQKMMLLQ